MDKLLYNLSKASEGGLKDYEAIRDTRYVDCLKYLTQAIENAPKH